MKIEDKKTRKEMERLGSWEMESQSERKGITGEGQRKSACWLEWVSVEWCREGGGGRWWWDWVWGTGSQISEGPWKY